MRGTVTPPYIATRNRALFFLNVPPRAEHLFIIYYFLFLIYPKGFSPGFSALNIHNFAVGTRKSSGIAGCHNGLVLPHAGEQVGLALIVQLAQNIVQQQNRVLAEQLPTTVASASFMASTQLRCWPWLP